MEKNCHFPIWKSLEKVFLSVSMEKENNFSILFRLGLLIYIFIIFCSKLMQFHLYRVKYYSAYIWPGTVMGKI